jgi:hypothetical protein
MILNEPVRAFLKREEIRRLKKEAATTGSADAAERLLIDSTRKGHDKLALHRYALLHCLDSSRCTQFESYCQAAAARMSPTDLRRVFEHVDRVRTARRKSSAQL